MASNVAVEEIAKRVNNWGRWGRNDQLGTLNHITPERIVAARELIKRGITVPLSIPFSSEGVQTGIIARENPKHSMISLGKQWPGSQLQFTDDRVDMHLQAATHWDCLAHVIWGDRIYNDTPATEITSEGAQFAGCPVGHAITGAGVLLDVAAVHDVATLDAGYGITNDDLDHAAARAGGVQAGDIVLVRTGQMRHFLAGDRQKYCLPAPGLTAENATWFHEHDVAAVAIDTFVGDVFPLQTPEPIMARLASVEMGMLYGQNWQLEQLAAAGATRFFISAGGLQIPGAVGIPVSAFAVL